VIVAAVQMSSQRDIGQNLRDAETLIAQAVERGAKLVVLPENFSYLGAEDSERAAVAERMGDGQAQSFLAEQASRHGLWLVGGTIPIWDGDREPRSRSLLVGPDGAVVAQYDKLHLFDVVIPDNESESYRESERTAPGDAPAIAATPLGRIGMTVCYDLRFPALFHRLSVVGMDILVVPAAFTVPTGRVHWDPLLRTRAFESLCYVVASGQWGEHAGGRLTYGHSSIVSPWGELIATLESGTGVVSAELDFEALRALRTKFPVLQHRREF
jgi:predicted amidohydrolase